MIADTREGGDPNPDALITISLVSIRAPREGGDVARCNACDEEPVSIRAPREGGDAKPRLTETQTYCFNPRPP